MLFGVFVIVKAKGKTPIWTKKVGTRLLLKSSWKKNILSWQIISIIPFHMTNVYDAQAKK